ncbi:MAG: hypothetical protein AAFW84_16585 [Cyanobacteria bacterium J06635_15]
MAKKNSKGRVRVFFAEIEGDDETIQDGLKAMASAVGKTFQPNIVKIVQNQPLGLPGEEALDEIDEALEDLEDLDDVTVDGEVTKKKPKPNGKKRKPPKMTLVKSLDFHPDGKTSFADFVEEKGPSTQYEQIVVSVYWMKKLLELDGLTFDHVYTCFDEANWKIPTNLPQIVRNCAAKKGWVEIEEDDIVFSTKGKNQVEHELGKE